MIHKAKEGETTWISDLSAPTFPHPLPKGIKLHLGPKGIGVESQGLVGTIPLQNGDVIRIAPKIDQVNFMRLLLRAEGAQDRVEREFEEFVDYATHEDAGIESLVYRQLFLSLDRILAQSPRSARIEEVRYSDFAQGRVDLVATSLKLSQRARLPVRSVLKRPSLSTPENRILTESALRAWQSLEAQDRPRFEPIYHAWIGRFPRSDALRSDMALIEEAAAKGDFGGARWYYQKAMMLAMIVMGSSGLSIEGTPTLQGDPMLINTADIFEKFLRNVIREAYSPAGYLVTKGGATLSKSLYTDGAFEIEPDIVISRKGSFTMLADAKYKKPDVSDHYQMLSYLRVYGLKRGVLIAPQNSGNKVEVREFSTHEKTVIREVYVPIHDLGVTEAFLENLVEACS